MGPVDPGRVRVNQKTFLPGGDSSSVGEEAAETLEQDKHRVKPDKDPAPKPQPDGLQCSVSGMGLGSPSRALLKVTIRAGQFLWPLC